jgi:putative peptide zinc metalloprotease protein
LSERPEEDLPARIIREVPAGRDDDLPSKALSVAGGGRLPIDPRDPQQNKTYSRLFLVDLELPAQAAATAFGSRAYVRFDLRWEPVGLQVWRRTRQLLLSRLSA